jgi:predicted transcriptional regulator
MARLTLDTTGIKSPLDIGGPAAPDIATPKRRAPKRGQLGERPSPRRAPHHRSSAGAEPPPAPPPPFYGAGRPIQTSLALDPELARQLDELARAAAVTFSALLVATLHRGLPTSGEQALRAVVTERADRPRGARVERNIRLPEQLRVRLDQLTENVRDATRRATRSDLANAALRVALPADAEHAAALVTEHHRRLEMLPLAA